MLYRMDLFERFSNFITVPGQTMEYQKLVRVLFDLLHHFEILRETKIMLMELHWSTAGKTH